MHPTDVSFCPSTALQPNQNLVSFGVIWCHLGTLSLGFRLIDYFEFKQGIVKAGLVVGQHLNNVRFNTVFAWLTMQIGHDVSGAVAWCGLEYRFQH
jgi:hypothetical protein